MVGRLDDILQAWRGRAGPVIFDAENREIDAAGFEALIAGAERWLRGLGIGAGDRIALWLVNRPEWLAILFACARIGAAVAAVNTRYRSSELTHILHSSGAKLLVLAPGFGNINFLEILAGLDGADLPELERIALVDAGTVLPARLIGRPVVRADLSPAASTGPDGKSDPDAALIFFTTSGTTSAPKLVIHPQRTLTRHAMRAAAAYGFDEEGAALLAAMPFCGVFGLSATLAAIAGGAPLAIMAMFEGAEGARRVRAQGITHIIGSDELFRRLLEEGEDVLSRTRLCGYATFNPAIAETLQQAARAGVALRGLYGSSEVGAIFAVQEAGRPLAERLQGGGRPASPEAEVRIRDPESGGLLPPGVPGEIEIRAPTNFTGYFRNPEATAKAVDADGFFRSGDMGYLRGDGSFVYAARMGDAVRLSGFLTDPAEIEEVLRAAPGVAEAQVVTVTEGGQQRPAAFVVGAQGTVDTAAVTAYARDRLASYKVPIRIWEIGSFPVTNSANGEKIQRGRLRTMAQDRIRDEA